MKIVLPPVTVIKISSVPVGDIFKLNEGYFIRVESNISAATRKAVNLCNGSVVELDISTKVQVVDAEIVIK